eukprot:COSAG02_NODE_10708_length_1877_cov_1.951631_2_plen_178_part_00
MNFDFGATLTLSVGANPQLGATPSIGATRGRRGAVCGSFCWYKSANRHNREITTGITKAPQPSNLTSPSQSKLQNAANFDYVPQKANHCDRSDGCGTDATAASIRLSPSSKRHVGQPKFSRIWSITSVPSFLLFPEGLVPKYEPSDKPTKWERNSCSTCAISHMRGNLCSCAAILRT